MAAEVNSDDSFMGALLTQMDLSWGSCLKLALIVVGCWFAINFVKRFGQKLLTRVEDLVEKGTLPRNSAGTLKTIIPLGISAAKVLLIFVGVLMGLAVLNVSVSPFVYFLGFASMGISLGAQDTFADIIKGILTLIDGQISVGDTLSVNGSHGRITELGIRQLVLTHSDGSIEIFPYSKIETIQNFSRSPTTMETAFKLASSSSTDTFERLTAAVIKELQKDPDWKDYFLEEFGATPSLQFTQVGHKHVRVEVSLTIKNDPAGDFASEFNRRMLKALQKAQMVVPSVS